MSSDARPASAGLVTDASSEPASARTSANQTREAAPVSRHGPYARLEPGTCQAECLKADIYRDRQFGRWTCALQFSLLGDGTRVFCFLNLGRGGEPHAGPRSEYRRAWIIANEEQPRRRQILSARVFEGKIFEIRVGDVEFDSKQREHPKGAIYSVVREIVRRLYP